MVPSDHVTIQLVDGRMKRIDWSKISRVDGLPSRAAKTPSKSDDDEDAELERTPTLNARPQKAPQTASASPSLYGREQVGSVPIGPGVQPVMMRVDGTRPGTAALEYRPVALADGLQDYAEVGWRTGSTRIKYPHRSDRDVFVQRSVRDQLSRSVWSDARHTFRRQLQTVSRRITGAGWCGLAFDLCRRSADGRKHHYCQGHSSRVGLDTQDSETDFRLRFALGSERLCLGCIRVLRRGGTNGPLGCVCFCV